MAKAAETYRDVIRRFPSLTLLADAIGKPESTVRSWRTRSSIPPEYFDVISAAAKQLRVPVTARMLWDIWKSQRRIQTEGDPSV